MATRSPFPGMDPWLESHWNDVHHKIIDNLADQIAAGLPDTLFVRVEESVYVIDAIEGTRLVRPDVAMFDHGGPREKQEPSGAVAVAQPIRIILQEEQVTQGVIEIRELTEGHPLITAVEVLSPTNKQNRKGRREYLRKREDYFQAGVNVVELDLLRGGYQTVAVPRRRLQSISDAAYKCAVRRYGREGRTEIDLYPLKLRERLPRIGIPLRVDDADVVVDLQLPIDRVYERGRYGRMIDYSKPPSPPLSPEDAAWAAELFLGRSD